MAHSENEIDITPMLKDINEVLKGHLSSLLGPIINEKNAIQNVLLNMPYVKRLKAENEVLKRHIFQLKTELESNKKFYEKELENASKKNVKLEVRDKLTNSTETPSKIVELKKEMWRKNEKVNSQGEEEEDDDEDYIYDEEDDDEEDEEEEEDEDYESPIVTNLRMSLINNNNAEEVVEITSNGTVESNENDDKIKNVTVWNLNSTEETETKNEEEEEEEVDDGEEEEEDDDEEEEDDDEEEEDDDDEEEEDDDNDEEDDEEEVDDDEEQEEKQTSIVENDEEEEDEEEEEEDEELDVEDVEIDGVQYLTTSTENGEIYKCDEDGEIMEDENGDFIICGYFKNGIANFI